MASTTKRVIVYTDEKNPAIKRSANLMVGYATPRMWDGKVLSRYTHVYAPDHPQIEAAYEEKGKGIYRPDGEVSEPAPTPTPTPEPTPEPASEDADDTPDEDEGDDTESDVEPHWRDLTWAKMRSLATQYTDEPVKSKDQAIEVLEQAESEGKL